MRWTLILAIFISVFAIAEEVDINITDARTRFFREYSKLIVSFRDTTTTSAKSLIGDPLKLIDYAKEGTSIGSIDPFQIPRESFKNEGCSAKISVNRFDYSEMVIDHGGFKCTSSDSNRGGKEVHKVNISFEENWEYNGRSIQVSCLFPESQFDSCNEIKISDINNAISDFPIRFAYRKNPVFWSKTIWHIARGKGIWLPVSSERFLRSD